MSLPRVIPSLILSALIFLLFSTSVAAANPPYPTDNPTTTNEVKPLPTPKASPEIVPIPLPDGDPNIEETALGLGFLGDLAGGFLDCIKGPKTCVQSGFEGLISAGVWIVEASLLQQFLGEGAGDLINIISEEDPEALSLYLEELQRDPSGQNSGLLGVVSNATYAMTSMEIPISTTTYFASINPVSQAKAQDTGVSYLADTNIVLDIWTQVRNISYAFSAVILVILGFLIMIRKKLDPRTSVTAANSLPRIVIGLILITFSFAISGVLIDLVRLIGGVGELIGGSQVGGYGVGFAGIVSLVAVLAVASLATEGIAAVVALLVALLLAIVFVVVFAIIAYKLVTRYVIFLILTMFAPLFFLFGSLPGAEGLILNWFKRSFAALLALPMVAFFLNLSIRFFTSAPNAVDFPPLFFGVPEQLFSWLFLSQIIGIGLLFFCTKVPDIVDELVGIKDLGARKGIGPGFIVSGPAGAARSVSDVTRTLDKTKKVRESAGARLAEVRGGIRARVGRVFGRGGGPPPSGPADDFPAEEGEG